MGFWIGFLVGIIVSPILLVLVGKPLAMWFIKRKAKGFVEDVKKNVLGKMNNFQDGESTFEYEKKNN